MGKIIIRDYINENLDTGIWGEYFEHFDKGYVYDYMNDVIEFHVPANIDSLLEWAKDNSHYIERAVGEFGVDTRNFDFFGTIESGRWLQLQEDIEDYLDDCIVLAVLSHIPVGEITHKQLFLLGKAFASFDVGSTPIERLIAEAKEIIAEADES